MSGSAKLRDMSILRRQRYAIVDGFLGIDEFEDRVYGVRVVKSLGSICEAARGSLPLR